MNLIEKLDELEKEIPQGEWEFREYDKNHEDAYTYKVGIKGFDDYDRYFINDKQYYPIAPDTDTARFLVELRNAWPKLRDIIITGQKMRDILRLVPKDIYNDSTIQQAHEIKAVWDALFEEP